MSVASLEFCKELYELSGWKPDGEVKMIDKWWREPGPQPGGAQIIHYVAPKYDLGYLIRRLPKQIPYVGDCPAAVWFNKKLGKWQTGYTWHVQGSDDNTKSKYFEADTPEDAACKLLLELFKQNILKKEEK